MANSFFVTNSVAQSMLTALGTAMDAGTAAVIEIYTTPTPADADATETGTMLARLTCSATAFSGISDAAPGALGTFDTITSDTNAADTGTATHFRIKTQSGGTVIAQGTVGTGSGYDLLLNTTSITSGSTVSITAATITLPEGP